MYIELEDDYHRRVDLRRPIQVAMNYRENMGLWLDAATGTWYVARDMGDYLVGDEYEDPAWYILNYADSYELDDEVLKHLQRYIIPVTRIEDGPFYFLEWGDSVMLADVSTATWVAHRWYSDFSWSDLYRGDENRHFTVIRCSDGSRYAELVGVEEAVEFLEYADGEDETEAERLREIARKPNMGVRHDAAQTQR